MGPGRPGPTLPPAMALEDRIARSRLIPPRPRPTWVRRPRVEARLREALEAPWWW
jgi:hypothetical protein